MDVKCVCLWMSECESKWKCVRVVSVGVKCGCLWMSVYKWECVRVVSVGVKCECDYG